MTPESNERLPFVYPKKFEKRYKELPDGSQKVVEWVVIAKKGVSIPDEIPKRWKDIERDPAMLQVLKPFYDHWKKGEETPINGTPLDVWMADADFVRVLNSVNIRSVEEFAQLEDHALVKLNIPSARDKQNRARAFLKAKKSTVAVSKEVAALRDKNETLERELAELRAIVEQHAIKAEPEAAPVKRGPGRPRKQPVENAA